MQTLLRRYFWVVTPLFLIGAAYLSAKLVSQGVTRLVSEDVVEARLDKTRSTRSGRTESLASYRVIHDRNLFNANPTSQPVAAPVSSKAPEEFQPAIAHLDMNRYALVGTGVRARGKSFALISVDREVKLVKLGGELHEGVKLKKVMNDRVVLNSGATMGELLLFDANKQAADRRVSRVKGRGPERERKDKVDENIRKVGDDSWLIDSREVENATANISKLMTQIRVVPNLTESGQSDGFKVFSIRPSSIFAKIGIKNGDVIKRINEIELSGPTEALEAYQQLQGESMIKVDLERRKVPKTLTYEIR